MDRHIIYYKSSVIKLLNKFKKYVIQTWTRTDSTIRNLTNYHQQVIACFIWLSSSNRRLTTWWIQALCWLVGVLIMDVFRPQNDKCFSHDKLALVKGLKAGAYVWHDDDDFRGTCVVKKNGFRHVSLDFFYTQEQPLAQAHIVGPGRADFAGYREFCCIVQS